MKAIGTDEDSALHGILEETDGQTIHLLGKEHIQQNVAKKLAEYSFPERQKSRMLKDILGNEQQTDCLYECKSFEEFDKRVEECKDTWAVLERVYTRNDPPTKFLTHFEKYKQNSICNHMIKAVRVKANEVRVTFYLNWFSKGQRWIGDRDR